VRLFIELAIATASYAAAFEVSSVKVINHKTGATKVETTPGSLSMRNIGLGAMVMWAYKISPLQISNAGVLGSDFYEISAKAAGAATTDEMRVMMQALLTERFKMVSHRESRPMSAYALVQTKNGHKLRLSEAGDGDGVRPMTRTKLGLTGHSATLDQLAFFLSAPLGTPVIDKTGLAGRYDFELDLTNYRTGGPGSGDPPADPVAVMQSSLSSQLGLRLEARRMAVEMLVIDHIELKPLEN